MNEPSTNRQSDVLNRVVVAIPPFVCSTLVVLMGAAFGLNAVPLGHHASAVETDILQSLAAWDGEHYERIAREGYSYDPNAASNVAFFPVYPYSARLLSRLTGFNETLSLIVVANTAPFVAYVMALAYCNVREETQHRNSTTNPGVPEDGAAQSCRPYILVTMAFFPTTFYFHMAFTESLFLLEVILVMYCLRQNLSMWLSAAVIGVACGTRASGLALVVPFCWHLMSRSRSLGGFLISSALTLPLACSGLIVFSLLQLYWFGDPFAFAKTQRYWDERPPISLIEKLWLEVILEPVFCELDPNCVCYGRHAERERLAFYNMHFANPIYLVAFAGLLWYGWRRRWLSVEEILVGVALLSFSYLSKGYATCMSSQARYASTVFPVYLVMAKWLQTKPPVVMAYASGIGAFLMGAYAALFVRWHDFY